MNRHFTVQNKTLQKVDKSMLNFSCPNSKILIEEKRFKINCLAIGIIFSNIDTVTESVKTKVQFLL